MSYLDRLKSYNLQSVVEKTETCVLPKLPKPPFDSLGSINGGHISEGSPATEEELYLLIRKALQEIGQSRQSWNGWRSSLAPEKRQLVREAEKNIEKAYGELDGPGLHTALHEYRSACLP